MSRNVLYTYSNLNEFNQVFEEVEQNGDSIIPFEFQETKKVLEEETGYTIDISSFIELVIANPSNRLSAIINLKGLDSNNRIIVREELAEEALRQFRLVFSSICPLFDAEPKEAKLHTISRKKIYTYQDLTQLNELIKFAEEKSIPFYTFNQASKHQNPELSSLDKSDPPPLVDITSMINAATTINNSHIVYFAEQLIEMLSNSFFIAQNDTVDSILNKFPLHFDSKEDISVLYPQLVIEISKEHPVKERKTRKVVQFTQDEIHDFEEFFSNNLIGHNYFKNKMFRSLRNFIKLNKIKEKKILSIFLLGDSGLGKTEVARLIAAFLNPDTPLAKINFGNYSSQDALNSLIGSPAGYVGCESGELGIKTANSKAGVVVCDEFDKTTRPVFNFFLGVIRRWFFYRFYDSRI